MRLFVLAWLLIPAISFAEPRRSLLEPGSLGLGKIGARVGLGISPDAPSLGGLEVMVGLGPVDVGVTTGVLGFASEGAGFLPGFSLQARLADLGRTQLFARTSLQLASFEGDVGVGVAAGVLRLSHGDRDSAWAFYADLVGGALLLDEPDPVIGLTVGTMAVTDHVGVYLAGGVGYAYETVFPMLSLGLVFHRG
jgi:hypothetical protein